MRLLKRCNLLSSCAVGEESPAYDGEKTNDRWIGLEIADEQITAGPAGIFREWLRMAFQVTFFWSLPKSAVVKGPQCVVLLLSLGV